MSTNWPVVPLGEVIQHRKQFITIDDMESYKRCRVQLHAKGIVLRDRVAGAEIKTKLQQVCKTGEFLVAEIDAKLGGFGLVPPDLDGAVVSSHYFLFTINDDRLDRRFLEFYSKTPSFQEQIAAQGSTNYAAIRPSHVLSYTIPLPPLDEQQRIVVRIEELAAKIEEARQLRRENENSLKQMVPQYVEQTLGDGWTSVPIASLLREDTQNGIGTKPSDVPPGLPILRISAATSRTDDVVNESDHKYIELDDHEARRFFLKPDDLLACRFNGNLHYVGKFAIYRGSTGGMQVYPDKLIRFRVDEQKADPEFICLAMNSRKAREQIESFCATTAGNIGISAGNLKTVKVAVPPLQEQRRIVASRRVLQAKADALRGLQSQSAAELNTMLASILDKAIRGAL